MTNVHRILAVLFAVGVLTACSASVALAHRGRVFGSSFGDPGSGVGQLSLAIFHDEGATAGGSGIAVDESSHDVYVADTGNHRVDEFSSTGVFVRAWGWGVVNGAAEIQVCTQATGCQVGVSGTNPGEFEDPASVAVDNYPGGEANVYIADDKGTEFEDARVQKFTSAGVLIESWGSKGQVGKANVPAPQEFGAVKGVAIAPSGELLVNTGNGVFGFERVLGTYTGRIGGNYVGGGPPVGLAVDRSGDIYISSGREVKKYNSEGIEFNNPLTKSAVFEFKHGIFPFGLAVTLSGELLVNEGGNTIQVVAASCVLLCAPSTTFTSPLLTAGAGLAVDSGREVVYIAETVAEKVETIVPEPPSAPAVEAGSQSVSNVSGDSATLEAVVSPRSEPDEEPTSYRFQYTTEESFQREGWTGAGNVPVPDGQLAPSFEEDRVTVHPQGLEPGTVYHYRVMAENAISRKEGKSVAGELDEHGEEVVRTFTTQTPGVFALPDGRAWELVSPPDKHGALIESIGVGETNASPDGDAFTYIARAPTESQPAGNEDLAQVLATRNDGSWGSRDIATPHGYATGSTLGGSTEYKLFSEDLSLAVVEPFDYLEYKSNLLSAEASERTPYLRADYVGGDRGDPCVSSCYRPLVTGASGFANVPEGTEFGESREGERCRKEALCGKGPGVEGMSPDGSHVVLSSKVSLMEGAPGGTFSQDGSLYEWAGGQLQLVSVLPGGEPAPTGSSPFLGGFVTRTKIAEVAGTRASAVSTDGSRVVWTTGSETAGRLYVRDMPLEETVELGGAGAGFQTASVDGSRVFFTVHGDLYVWEAPLAGPLSDGHTTDLTPAGGLRELVLGASRDGSSVYFVASGVLTGAEAANGETAQAGRPNLYVYRGGVIKLVAVLSEEDEPDWGGNDVFMTTTRVSSEGHWLAFMSERSLTGYDNRDLTSGERDEEVFLYDTDANGGEGRLVCASCDATGARPRGIFDLQVKAKKTALDDKQSGWGGRWLSGSVPGWTSLSHQSRYLSDSGRLFFNSSDPLVASDTNGTEDVYEYEPQGVGDCSSVSLGFVQRSGGCVTLVSSGTAREGAVFLDASETGSDVFFFTSAQLAPQDRDTSRDVYDARVDGGVPVAPPPPACEGDACQSPVAAPNDPTPGSLTYRGPGNPVPLLTVSKTKKKLVKCAKTRKLVHGKCVKKGRKARRASGTYRIGKGRRSK